MKNNSFKDGYNRYKKSISKRLFKKRIRKDGKLITGSAELRNEEYFTFVQEKEFVDKYKKLIFRQYYLCDRAEREISSWEERVDIFSFKYLNDGFLYGFDIAVNILNDFLPDELANDLEKISIYWGGDEEFEISDKYTFILYFCSPVVHFKNKKYSYKNPPFGNTKNNRCCIIDSSPTILAYENSDPEILIEGKCSEVTFVAEQDTGCSIRINQVKLLHVISNFKKLVDVSIFNSISYGLIRVECKNFHFQASQGGAFLLFEDYSKGVIDLNIFKDSQNDTYIIILRSNVDVEILVDTKIASEEKLNHKANILIYNLGGNQIIRPERMGEDVDSEKGICKISSKKPDLIELTILNPRDNHFEKKWETEMFNPYKIHSMEKIDVSINFSGDQFRVDLDDIWYEVDDGGLRVSEL